MRPASLRTSAVTKAFTTGKIRQQVLKETDVSIFPGELTLIVGPSGSGKSTLLSILSGLLRPDEGTVTALDTDLWSIPGDQLDDFRLRHCGFVFQGFNLFPALTALEQVMLPLGYTGIPGPKVLSQAQTALDEVGLGGKAHLRPAELSGGEKQRVAIARALAKDPQLLFADEPTSALDGRSGHAIAELLHGIAHHRGATVLGVTHDPRLLEHADRVLRLEDGAILDGQGSNHPSPAKES